MIEFIKFKTKLNEICSLQVHTHCGDLTLCIIIKIKMLHSINIPKVIKQVPFILCNKYVKKTVLNIKPIQRPQ